jgi:hypothetical protein
VRYRLDRTRGHLQVGSVYRSIGGFVGSGAVADQVFGVGAVISGSALVVGRDTVVFESTLGKGVSRYVKDTSGQGLDAALADNGRLEAARLGAVLTGYQRVWTRRLRSTLAVSFVGLGHLSGQPADTYHTSRYLTANLMFKPFPVLTVGVELDQGRLSVSDGRHNEATRLQIAVKYDLVK